MACAGEPQSCVGGRFPPALTPRSVLQQVHLHTYLLREPWTYIAALFKALSLVLSAAAASPGWLLDLIH